MSKEAYYSIQVLYDAACPVCVKDRQLYEKLIGVKGKSIYWCDFNQHSELLNKHNISSAAAMAELHLIVNHNQIVKDIDAYAILLSQILWLKPIAWIISLPLIKPLLASYYRRRVNARLKRTGRI